MLSTRAAPGERKDGWNVPEFTVTRIFERDPKPTTLRIRTKGIYRLEIDDVPGAFWFEDDMLGIRCGV